jgi:hypothetical protein
MTTDFLKLTLGEKFGHEIPPEGMSIILAGGVPLLAFNFSITDKDTARFLNGKASFGLFSDQDILFFLFKIEGFLDWSDLAFTVHLANGETVVDNGAYLPCSLVLVDSATDTITGLRMVTVSPAFRKALAEVLQRQAQGKFDTIGYYQSIGKLYDAYPSASAMLKNAVIVEHGGITLPGQG